MKKIVLVGANHAGTAAANTILDNYKDHKLVIFDANDNISYLGCGSALWIGRQINEPSGLFYCSKAKLESKDAKVYMETPVEKVDFGAKKVIAKTKDGKTITESYDKLIIATGSLPNRPNVKGIELENVCRLKIYQDAQKLEKLFGDDSIKNVAVVGAGYIGVELAEAVKRRGKNALLFDASPTSLSTYYDEWFTKDMDEVLKKGGVECHFGEMLKEIEGNKKVSAIVTNKGRYPVDVVVLCIGFKPNTEMFKDELEMLTNGAIQVDRNQKTSQNDVYAIGDCATIYSNALQDRTYIALATNAVRSGIVAAHNVCGGKLDSTGVQGSNGICIFDYKMVSTGYNMEMAKRSGFNAVYTEYEDMQKPAFMKTDNYKVKVRIVYEKDSRRILGAQMASYHDISMGIHLFSLAIEEGITIDKLKLLDIFFLPHFNQPYNYITMAALKAN